MLINPSKEPLLMTTVPDRRKVEGMRKEETRQATSSFDSFLCCIDRNISWDHETRVAVYYISGALFNLIL